MTQGLFHVTLTLRGGGGCGSLVNADRLYSANIRGMEPWRHGLLLALLLGWAVDGWAGTVLTIITPGPQSHMFGMKKITLEMAARGHKVAVRFAPPCWICKIG